MTMELADYGHLGGYVRTSAEFPNGDPGCYFPTLWKWMIDTLRVKTMLDVGCGEGHAMKWFADHRCSVFGLEGCREAIKAGQVRHRVYEIDFTKQPVTAIAAWPWFAQHDFGLVWSSEFVEHVEEQFIDNFLPAFQRGRFVAMTHAFPGQPGHHHVNCQPAEYWIERMKKAGLTWVESLTMESRKLDADGHWQRSGLIFRRDG